MTRMKKKLDYAKSKSLRQIQLIGLQQNEIKYLLPIGYALQEKYELLLAMNPDITEQALSEEQQKGIDALIAQEEIQEHLEKIIPRVHFYQHRVILLEPIYSYRDLSSVVVPAILEKITKIKSEVHSFQVATMDYSKTLSYLP